MPVAFPYCCCGFPGNKGFFSMISKAQSGPFVAEGACCKFWRGRKNRGPQGNSCLAAGHGTVQVLDSCWSFRNDRADMWDHFSETVKGSPSMLGT